MNFICQVRSYFFQQEESEQPISLQWQFEAVRELKNMSVKKPTSRNMRPNFAQYLGMYDQMYTAEALFEYLKID